MKVNNFTKFLEENGYSKQPADPNIMSKKLFTLSTGYVIKSTFIKEKESFSVRFGDFEWRSQNFRLLLLDSYYSARTVLNAFGRTGTVMDGESNRMFNVLFHAERELKLLALKKMVG